MRKTLLSFLVAGAALVAPASAETPTIQGVWASTINGQSCDSPRLDAQGRRTFLEVGGYGFFYGTTESCQFDQMLPQNAVRVSGDFRCTGQNGPFSGAYDLTLDNPNQMTFIQGVGSARFVQTMQRCTQN